jgi:hypothetical protein
MEEALEILARIKKTHPELRLGQILENAMFGGFRTPDLFYKTDEELAKGLQKFEEMIRGDVENFYSRR